MSNLEISLITILAVIVYLIMGVGFYKVQKQGDITACIVDVALWPLCLVYACLIL